jgi:hypothetical protein
MCKTKYLSVIIALFLLFLLSETNVCADGIGGPFVAGLSLIVIVAIMLAIVFLLAYLIVWLFKRKK